MPPRKANDPASNAGLRIRRARPGEMDAVAALIRDAYRQYEKDIPGDAWQDYLDDIMDVRSRLGVAQLLVAEVDGKLAGSVTLYPHTAGPEGWAGLRILAVHPDFRGRGISRAIMEECIRRCRRQGAVAIGLHTSRIMEVARGLYERMGFERVPEFDFHPRPDVNVMAYSYKLQKQAKTAD